MKPTGDVLRRTEYVVEPVPFTMGKQLIQRHHYTGGAADGATFRHGLFHRDNFLDCLGVAFWAPVTQVVGRSVAGEDWRSVVTLARLAVEPHVPTNAASFLLGQSIKLIRADSRYRWLVTYADEGQGHTGAIYRATNWSYLGANTGDPVWTDPKTGRRVTRRTSKDGAYGRSRTRAQMLEAGYIEHPPTRKHKFVMRLA